MSKTQKEKSVTKERLIGMKVIDAEGNLVGTVKDVSFTIGKVGISLSVEDKNGEIRDIPWEDIQGAGDFVILKPVTAAAAEVPTTPAVITPPMQPTQPIQPQPTPAQPICPTCRKPLSYIKQYQRWYCYNCKKYV